MPVADILLLVFFAVAIVTGALRGAVRQIGTVVAFVLALMTCRAFGATIAGAIVPEGSQYTQVWTWSVYAALFVLVFVGVTLIAHLLQTTFAHLRLNAVNRIAGALLRTAIWGIALSICLNIYFAVAPADRARFEDGRPWRTTLVDVAPALLGYIAGAGT